MKIYQPEIDAGIGDLITASASIAYCSVANVVGTTTASELAEATDPNIEKLIAGSNPDQVDLYYLDSVLVSTGWNKNDDVFLSASTWAARKTPEDKQFNFMHDENDIIGHITGCYVVDKDGSKAEGELSPEAFDIITEAVLYNSWIDPENRERMQNIIAEIEDGKWFVSMECLFSDFDYAIIDPQGKHQLLERDQASAFLTKHLRAYGGEGKYEGYKIGRALRNIAFSGKGLVSNPANPRSVILNSTKAFDISEEEKITIFSGEINMSNDNTNVLEQQVADLKEGLATARVENEAIKAKIEEAKDKEFASTVQAFESDLASKDESIATLEEAVKASDEKISELEDASAQKDEALAEAVAKIEQQEAEAKLTARKAALIEAGAEEEEAEETLAAFSEATDEMFEQVIALTKSAVSKSGTKKKGEFPPKDEEDDKKKKKDEDSNMKKGYSESDKAAEETEEEAVEASDETFENLESSEATLVEASQEEDKLQSTRASVAEWLTENVLSN
tara:strand:- start:4199 stop:5719 length:1521 start_codon:yes stop_codon:yes gene_type:complete